MGKDQNMAKNFSLKELMAIAKKRADLLQDEEYTELCVRAAELGYDIKTGKYGDFTDNFALMIVLGVEAVNDKLTKEGLRQVVRFYCAQHAEIVSASFRDAPQLQALIEEWREDGSEQNSDVSSGQDWTPPR